MSSSISPELGILLKVFIFLIVLLGVEYIAVLFKLSMYDSHSFQWKLIVGSLTPCVLLLGFSLSGLVDNKIFNVISILLLTLINLSYLSLPLNKFLTSLMYSTTYDLTSTILIGITSIITSFFALLALIGIVYWIFVFLKTQ